GLPFSGPIGGVRVALIDGQWVAFPTWTQLERATFNMVVAGRLIDGSDDVAIMMVEAEGTEHTLDLVAEGATAPDERVVADGLDAAKPFIRELCRAQQRLADAAAKPTGDYPLYPAYEDDVYEAVAAAATDELNNALATPRSEEHTSELQSRFDLVCRLLLEKK